MNSEKYFKKVYNNIDRHGFNTTSIPEEKDFTPFAYSIGIYESFKVPELFISGLLSDLIETS